MNQEDVNLVLKNHQNWLLGVSGGSRADFLGKTLSGLIFDESGTSLERANFGWACLDNVHFKNISLKGSYFGGTNLSRTTFKGVNLTRCDFLDCTGNNKHIKTIQAGKYIVNYTAEIIQIGCENHPIEDWFSFSDEKIARMDDGALDWWKDWKPILKQILEVSPAEP